METGVLGQNLREQGLYFMAELGEIAVNQFRVQSQARTVTVRGPDPAHSSAGDEEEQEQRPRKGNLCLAG